MTRRISIGYSKNMRPNPKWREQGLCCKYEHCIENSPLETPRSELSCYVFGHNCPGGLKAIAKCRERESEVWDNISERLPATASEEA